MKSKKIISVSLCSASDTLKSLCLIMMKMVMMGTHMVTVKVLLMVMIINPIIDRTI